MPVRMHDAGRGGGSVTEDGREVFRDGAGRRVKKQAVIPYALE